MTHHVATSRGCHFCNKFAVSLCARDCSGEKTSVRQFPGIVDGILYRSTRVQTVLAPPASCKPPRIAQDRVHPPPHGPHRVKRRVGAVITAACGPPMQFIDTTGLRSYAHTNTDATQIGTPFTYT
eukprot:1825155-Rhodomonas_salina.3